MSGEDSVDEAPKFNRRRRGSVDDTIKDFLNPKLEFHKNALPKGSNALQILINQCEDENHKKEESDDSDVDDDKMKKPSKAYMGRRRNTIDVHYNHGLDNQFRRMSLAPIPEGSRGRMLLTVPKTPRTRSLSPLQENIVRRQSIHHTDVGFGSSHSRETMLK